MTTPSPSEAVPTPPETPAEPAEVNEFAEAEAAFRYDPFLNDDEAQRLAAEAAKKPEPAPEPTPAPAPVAATPEPTPAPAQPADPRVDRLTEATEALLRAQQQQMERGQAPAQPAEPVDDLPPYNFQVPQELVNAILNPEDPARQVEGLNTLLRGSFRAAHKIIRDEVVGKIKELQESFDKNLKESVSQAVVFHAVHTDYYSKFPNHSNPAVQAVVRELMPQVAKELNATGWTPQLRDALGERVNAHLRKIAGLPDVPAAAPQPQPSPQPTPPALRPSNTRPQPGPSGGIADEILDTFRI